MGTAVEVRRGFDLTRAPDEQWSDEMITLVARSVFRGMEVTRQQLYYCLAVAEGVGLNPLIGEVYFLPAKSRDGKGPGLIPYVGRNGLVRKAADHGCYFEADTVHANDNFRVSRKRDGTIEVAHSYSPTKGRGEVVGAYAFLHDEDGRRKPAFFFAELDQYLPSYDADWKLAASPWGNQLSAMIEKCAMIGAGRKRLHLGNVLGDGELERVQQQRGVSGPVAEHAPGVFDWPAVARAHGDIVAGRLREAVEHAREIDPEAWPAAKLEMMGVLGMDTPAVVELAASIEREFPGPAPAESLAGDDGDAGAREAVQDAQVVADGEREAVLRLRLAGLEEAMEREGVTEDDIAELAAEHDHVRAELAALKEPGQGSLL